MGYRQIWERKNGPIPRDETGRTYDIHHIDGNRKNNALVNLKAVSLKEHYEIHLAQGDYGAAARIAQRMKLDPEVTRELCRQAAQKRVADGNNAFLGGEVQRRTNRERLEAGTHHLLSGEQQRTLQRNLYEKGTHNWQKYRDEAIKNGTYHFQGDRNPSRRKMALGIHHFQEMHTCPHCGTIGKGSVMKRWHLDRCRHRKIEPSADIHQESILQT